MPEYVSLSNIFIDDILLSDGQMLIGVLGGAGVHAMAGARVWSASIGLIASVGKDFSIEYLKKLRKLGVDLSNLRTLQEKTTRAWQIFQPDEERIEIFRDKKNKVVQINLSDIEVLDAYHKAKGYHVHYSGTPKKLLENLELLHSLNPLLKIVMEPSVNQCAWGKAEFTQVLPLIDVFSPNSLEASKITGQANTEKIIEELILWGADKIALRMGEQGSLIAGKDFGAIIIPAISESVVDVTGAGNAYLGGLLVGICEGLSLEEAALRGSISASFAIEQFGVCLFDDEMIVERDRRLAIARSKLSNY